MVPKKLKALLGCSNQEKLGKLLGIPIAQLRQKRIITISNAIQMYLIPNNSKVVGI